MRDSKQWNSMKNVFVQRTSPSEKAKWESQIHKLILWSLFNAEACEGPLKLKTILIKLLLPIFILNQFPLLAWTEISKVINVSPVNSMWEKVHKHLFLKKIYVQILAFFLERLMIDAHSRALWGWGMGHFVKYRKHCPCRWKANK